MSFVITLIALSIVIFIHELGHLLAAKWANIGVHEFAVGMGPKLVGKQWGDTVYSIRLFPIGGYVKLAGMDDDPDSVRQFPRERSMYHAKKLPRLMTLAAGSLFNVVLGLGLFIVVYSGFGVRYPSTNIEKVMPNSPAALVGLLNSDEILTVNGVSVQNRGDHFIKYLQKTAGPVHLVIRRDHSELTVDITPIVSQGRHIIGVSFYPNKQSTRVPPMQAIRQAGSATWEGISSVFVSLKLIVFGQVKPTEMAGVVGIVQMADAGLHNGADVFIKFMATISISLGIFNLLPLPALDGGHIVFLGIEAVTGQAVSRKWEAWITNAGFALLMLLMVFISVNDVRHWSERRQILHQSKK